MSASSFLKSKLAKVLILSLGLLIIIGIIAAIKVSQIKKEITKYKHMKRPAATVSTAKVKSVAHMDVVNALGTLVAVNGVDVTPQVPGQVTKIFFKSGQIVQKGYKLIQLDDRSARSELLADHAQVANDKINLNRSRKLYHLKAASKSDLDLSTVTYQKDSANLRKQEVLVSQHTIRAPFSGRLGIRNINIGQYLNPGINIVSLQTQNPMLVNFSLPESKLADLKVGQVVTISPSKANANHYKGILTAISSKINPNTRMLQMQATVNNPLGKLTPGGFVEIEVPISKAKQVVVIPTTAVTYRLYGDSVYIVTASNGVNTANLHYVKLGSQVNADNVIVKKGLSVGQQVVSAGQNKLQDKSIININNLTKLNK